MQLIISGFPGIGKTTLVNSGKYPRLCDSDSSTFDKSQFPQNYIEHITERYNKGLDTLVSSHKVVRDALTEAKLPFVLVYPARACKEEYIQRYERRGSPEAFLKLLDDNWDAWITECEEFKGNKYEMRPNEFLAEAFDILIEDYCQDSMTGTQEIDANDVLDLARSIASTAIDTDDAELREFHVSILGGEIGSGKTTICALAASGLQKSGCNVLYIVEEDKAISSIRDEFAKSENVEDEFEVISLSKLEKATPNRYNHIKHVFVDLGRTLSPEERALFQKAFRSFTFITIVG